MAASTITKITKHLLETARLEDVYFFRLKRASICLFQITLIIDPKTSTLCTLASYE